MRTLLACLLLGASLAAKSFIVFDEVADDWRIDGAKLHATVRPGLRSLDKPIERAWPISVSDVAVNLNLKQDDVAAYLRGLDPKLPLLVRHVAGQVSCVWQLSEERLRKDLRLEMTPALAVRLVNTGSVVHRVVKPNDGSESGWREPEIYFEREVDGTWVRGGKPGRCGLYAHDWHKDIVDLKPREALPLEGYLPPEMAFGLAKPAKVKLRAVYVYRGGHGSKGVFEELDPGAMARTPPFTLFSEPVEVEIR